MPLSGWMMSSARGFPVSWFGLFQLPDLVPKNKALYEALLTTHGTLAAVLAAVVALHAAPALKPPFIQKEDVLRGIAPFPPPTPRVKRDSKGHGDGTRPSRLMARARAGCPASQFPWTAGGFEALGKLTIRGVTRDVRVPFTFRNATENGVAVGYMSGKTTLRRLDFGVGQGDWKATDQLGNDVGVSFALRLTAAAR